MVPPHVVLPLFPGLPGGIEVVVALLVFVVVPLIVLAALTLGLRGVLRGRSADAERVAELERRVEELEGENRD